MIKIIVKNNNNPIKLSVFDFDGVLFKSPEKPKEHEGNWWIEKISLAPETIGEIPKEVFWNDNVIQQAIKECSNKNTYCILLTGRIEKTFSDRIKQLLSQKNLKFKEVGLNEFGRDSADFKIEYINNILKKIPSIKNIEMWEDKIENAKLYTKEFSNKYNFKCNMIEE